MQGKGAELGMVQLFGDELFRQLEQDRHRSDTYTYNLKIRLIELIDEEAYDLMQPHGGHGFNKNALKYQEWEGSFIQGIKWIPVTSANQLMDFYTGGLKNRVERDGEFGPMKPKASQLL